jgi:hypothetical protein
MKTFRCGLAKDDWYHPEIDVNGLQKIEGKAR